MKSRLLSVLLVFLLVASVSIPAVSAEPSHVYYELHNLCLCEESEDLGHIPYLNWGIGYEAWIDKQTDNWKVFVHAGLKTKSFIITPEISVDKMYVLRDFVNNVNECKRESDQIPVNVGIALFAGASGSVIGIGGGLNDNAPAVGTGITLAGYSVEQVSEITTHFNNAKHAQKNAEKLFEAL